MKIIFSLFAIFAFCTIIPFYSWAKDKPASTQVNIVDIKKETEGLHQDVEEIKKNIEQQKYTMDIANTIISNSSKDISFFSWLTGIVIGFTGIAIAIGAFFIYRQHKEVTEIAKEKFDLLCDKLSQDANKAIEKIPVNAEQKKREIEDSLLFSYENVKRVFQIETELVKNTPSLNYIYSAITYLSINPGAKEAVVLKRVAASNLNREITKKAEEGLNNYHRKRTGIF